LEIVKFHVLGNDSYNNTKLLEKGVFQLPAIVGAVKVNSVGNSGIFNIGDVFYMAPDSLAKTFAGAGSFNTGDGMTISNHNSVTNTYDKDVADQNKVANL
jgi:spore germination protein PA